MTTFDRDAYDLWGELRLPHIANGEEISVRVFLSNDEDDRIYINVYGADDAQQAVAAAEDFMREDREDDSYTMDEYEAL